MSTKSEPTAAQKALEDFAPKLVELTDEVLFADVWERPQLSKRDRSLITCAALVDDLTVVDSDDGRHSTSVSSRGGLRFGTSTSVSSWSWGGLRLDGRPD